MGGLRAILLVPAGIRAWCRGDRLWRGIPCRFRAVVPLRLGWWWWRRHQCRALQSVQSYPPRNDRGWPQQMAVQRGSPWHGGIPEREASPAIWHNGARYAPGQFAREPRLVDQPRRHGTAERQG